ncbi:helix-turn-helix transcriptional regulator [Paenibacillus lautus]|uniref:helix-turn-helix transcriptional regulator n=1 Tax=Paenibacillus lautus TaxID=1401 RepID=UPI001C7CA9D0|nr:helix-turn-helix transcriptional regulator [Paenibacillus lautus]MBX4152399.1 helix-turn-helix domain-containing protein [Paenibacillus lautus]
MSIAKNIKKLRERFDLTQQELAEIAGVTNKAVSAWESGVSMPRLSAIEKISRRFDIKKSNIIEDGGMDEIGTFTAHLEGEDFTEEEMKEIVDFAKFIKSKRKSG